MRILHVISGLGTGGAEMMLFKLLGQLNGAGWRHHVIAIKRGGPLEAAIRGLGVPVSSLAGLKAALGELQPDVVQGWMYHGNLAASLAGCVAAQSKPPVLWNIRHSLYALRHEKPLTRWIIRANAWLSGQPAAIIYNSTIARAQHEALGFSAAQGTVIPNGFDMARFRKDADARARIRAALGIPPQAPVIGHVARWHPMKDQAGMLAAFAAFARRHPDAHLLLAGKGLDRSNADLAPQLAGCPAERVHLLGERSDVPDILNAMDVFTLNSAWGEAFPNVLGEAMACELPCVTTAIGDSAAIVGDTGSVIAPRSPEALATAWETLLAQGTEARAALGARARQRIEDNYAVAACVRQYADLYRTVAVRTGDETA